MKARVVWKPEERSKLRKRWLELKARGMYPGEALEAAQEEVLGAERRRMINSDAIRQIREHPDEGPAPQAAAEPPPPAAPIAPAEPPPPPPQPQEEEELAAFQRPRWTWRDMLADLLREAIVAAATDPRVRTAAVGFLSEIVPETVQEIAQAFGLRPKESSAAAPHIVSPKKSLETVLVVGGLPRQFERVRQTYADYFDLRHAAPEKPQAYIQSLARGASICYLMTDFISHSAQDAVLSLKGVPKAFVSGSMSSLEEALEERLNDRRRRGNGQAAH